MKKADIESQPIDLPGGGKAIIDWHRTLWLDGGDSKRPLRLDVTTTLRSPGSTGMPEGEEAVEVDNLIFRVNQQVKRRANGLHVMTIRGGGKVVLVYYMAQSGGLLRRRPARDALIPALNALAAEGGHALTLDFAEDPTWTKLLSIFGDHDPTQWQSDRAQMIAMAKAGDGIHARREVAHRVDFPNREACPPFLKAIRRMKFKPDGGPKATASKTNWVVSFQRNEPTLATWHLHGVVLKVKALAREHGGRYRGWETELIESKIPPPLTAPRGG